MICLIERVYNSCMISSSQNPRIKLVRALIKDSKERKEAGAFVVEGVRLVEEALQAGWPFRFVLTSEPLSGRGEKLGEALRGRRVPVEVIPDALMDSLSATETSQGILAVVDQQPFPLPGSLDFALILDSIRDPGNMGTLLRSAAGAGVQAVITAPDCVDPFSPKVVRSGMGAHFRLPILSMPWDEIKTGVKGLHIFLAEMEGNLSFWEANFKQPLALIIGGEADGATPQAREMADSQVTIPMPGGVESLNAATAGSILLFEVVRQRRS
jgi:RNA methyltransferase, TrmH family